MDQTLASKPGTSQAAVNLDLPPPRQPRTTSNVEQMEVDYGPTLPPHLNVDHPISSDMHSSPSEEPSKKASDRPKKHSHPHSKHDVDLRPASDHHNDESDVPRMSSHKKCSHSHKKHDIDRSLPWINTMMNPMTFGCHLLNKNKNMLTRVNIR